MAFPICDICASSGVLCAECEEKLRYDKISNLDVILSSLLSKHGADGYINTLAIEGKLIILASEEQAPKIIGTKGNTVSELSKKLGRRIIVLVEGSDLETILNSVARPSRLISKKNMVKEDGKEVLKLIFDKQLDEGTIELIEELVGKVEIGYEKNSHVRGTDREGRK